MRANFQLLQRALAFGLFFFGPLHTMINIYTVIKVSLVKTKKKKKIAFQDSPKSPSHLLGFNIPRHSRPGKQKYFFLKISTMSTTFLFVKLFRSSKGLLFRLPKNTHLYFFICWIGQPGTEKTFLGFFFCIKFKPRLS